MDYIHNGKKIEIYSKKTSGMNTAVTVAKDRVTIKIGEKDLGFFVKEEWQLIANSLSELDVEATHRGRVQIMPNGVYSIIKTERQNSKISFSYYRSLSKVVFRKITSEENSESGYDKILGYATGEYL